MNKKLSGIWKNDLGSSFAIVANCTFVETNSGTLIGAYNTAVGSAINKINTLTGTWSTTEDGAMMSFIVNFMNSLKTIKSVATFNGKYYAAHEKLVMTWILVSDKPYEDEWSNYIINKNVFLKISDIY